MTGAAYGALPPSAAWRHVGARDGFEAVFFDRMGDGGHRMEGTTAAVEDGETWIVAYEIVTDRHGVTRSASVRASGERGRRETRLASDGAGHWTVDGSPVAHLDGCHDVDLESSACTNLLPFRRLALPVDRASDAPAAYVRLGDLRVERLEQTYTRLASEPGRTRCAYAAPVFEFTCELVYDGSGLVVDYPGIATRAR